MANSSRRHAGLQLAAVPLAFLPAVAWTPERVRAPAAAALVAAALLIVAWLAAQDPSRGSGRAAALARHVDRYWTLFLLAIALAVSIVYVVVATRVTHIVQNDGAYYYGVARHMVASGRFEEPIVWHFLAPPDRIVHPPFDYWGGTTSLALVPSLAIFGATPRTAFVTMSVIFAGSLLAFWYLICVALPLHHWASQLIALELFAFSPAMAQVRFQPESTVLTELFILLALIAFARCYLWLAIVFGFGVFLSRSDGLILFGLIVSAALWTARRDRRELLRLGAVAGVCVAAYATWSTLSFGTPTPPGPRMLPFLAHYPEVFDFGVTRERQWSQLLERLDWRYIAARIELAITWLRGTPFTPAQDVWLLIALVPGLGLVQRRLGPVEIIWALCFVGYFALTILNGSGFNPGRTPLTFTPLVILAGALGVDILLARLDGWADAAARDSAAPSRRMPRRMLAGAVALGVCAVFLIRLPPVDLHPVATGALTKLELSDLDDVLRGEPVASNVPWFLFAHTASPTVSLPYNGEDAIAGVLERYQVRWVILFAKPFWVQGASRPLLKNALGRRELTIGRFRLERVESIANPSLYRVHAP